jgi:hypothetical protein
MRATATSILYHAVRLLRPALRVRRAPDQKGQGVRRLADRPTRSAISRQLHEAGRESPYRIAASTRTSTCSGG